MKTGLFFDSGRNFIILPQKSVPPLLNQGHPTDRLGENLFGRPISAYDFRIKV